VFIVIVYYFIIDSVWKLLDTPSYDLLVSTTLRMISGGTNHISLLQPLIFSSQIPHCYIFENWSLK